MSLIQFFSVKCKKCGNKFTINSNCFCKRCRELGIPCIHKNLCLNCFKDSTISNRIYFGSAIAIILVAINGLGGRIL